MGEVTFDRKGCRLLGRWFAEGITDHVARLIFSFFVALILLGAVLTRCAPTDGTDRDWIERSGVTLRTDYGTGCQYLESAKGSLTPRLDGAGHHLCGVGK